MDLAAADDLQRKIARLPGPVLVIGAGGFIGANLFRILAASRDDVLGTLHNHGSWRLDGLPSSRFLYANLLDHDSIAAAVTRAAPAVIFDSSAYGAYSFETDVERIHRTNYLATVSLLEHLSRRRPDCVYVHAGSSSEYGRNCAAPTEDTPLSPDSHYAVSKAATAQAIAYYGQTRGMACVNLRLYSVYGPYEDSSRLIAVLLEHSLREELPPFVAPDTSRDFLYVQDAAEAFVDAALSASRQEVRGGAYNIGSGVKTTIREVAILARELFHIKAEPEFGSMPGRHWDQADWYANPTKAAKELGWCARTDLRQGLVLSQAWWKAFLTAHEFGALTKKVTVRTDKNSVSAIIACYKDNQAIPIMHERLVKVFTKLSLDYEIIFVNDGSPDDTTEVVVALSERDPNVIGIVHARNFGSQAAFRSGMEVAAKEACVLLDGDLQDPPELIERFVEKWRAGADVVYGRRVAREMPGWLEFFYKQFYKVFDWLSEFPIPRDAGDFSLLDARVVREMLRCQERDSFLRGLRAYVGFRQEGVDYVRPERMFGVSTNNWMKNINWAKKAIFSFSRTPLHLLTTTGFLATLGSILFSVVVLAIKFIFPESAPRGITLVTLIIMLFGSINLLGLGLLGEYLGKIIEETKQRPPFVRASLISKGEIAPWRQE